MQASNVQSATGAHFLESLPHCLRLQHGLLHDVYDHLRLLAILVKELLEVADKANIRHLQTIADFSLMSS